MRVLALVSLCACQETVDVALEQEPVPNDRESVVFFVLSPPDVGIGDTAVLTVRARTGATLPRVGSFTLTLMYDPARLHFLDALPDGNGLRVHNAVEPGRIRLAGASPSGFDGDVYGLRFIDVGPSPSHGIVISVEELTGISSFVSLIPHLRLSNSTVSPLRTANKP